jgi:hypothetical protein
MIPALGLGARVGLAVWRFARPAVLLLGGVELGKQVGEAAAVVSGQGTPAGSDYGDPRSWAQRAEGVLGAVGRTAIVLGVVGGVAYSASVKRRRR